MTCYLDFDGTVVTFAHPAIGNPLEGVEKVISKLQQEGWLIVLNTYRVNLNDGTFEDALNYLSRLSLSKPITKYLKLKKMPPEWDAYHAGVMGSLYIDDVARGIPLKNGSVDWAQVDEQLIKHGFYGKE